MALESLEIAHHRLSMNALGQAIPSCSAGLPTSVIEQALEAIRRHRWAMRQSGWHRAGKPRQGPKARAAQQQG
jgi:hypothetical protein